MVNEEKDKFQAILNKFRKYGESFSFKCLHEEIANTQTAEKKKRYGQFFTPEEVAEFMARWVSESSKKEKILDPALGCGILAKYCLDVIAKNPGNTSITLDGYDIDNSMIECSEITLASYKTHVKLHAKDFLLTRNLELYDIIIANPPYVKNNKILNRDEYTKSLRNEYGITLDSTASLYSYFIIKCLHLLSEGGVFAFIVPVEWFNAGYGITVKDMLLESLSIEALIVFEGRDFIFEDGMSSAVIILGKKDSSPSNEVHFFGIKKWLGVDWMLELLATKEPEEPNTVVSIKQSDIDIEAKWSSYLNRSGESLLENTIPLSQLFFVRRGIATGANDFFTLSDDEILKWAIPSEYLEPIITKASFAKSPAFTCDQFELLRLKGKKTHLLNIPHEQPDERLRKYLDFGIEQNIHERYLTRKRKKWFFVEQRKIAPIWIKVFFRGQIQLILNQSNCRNLTSFHGIYPREENEKYLIPLIMFSTSAIGLHSMSFQIRHYGGGLKKLEPRDVEAMSILDFSLLNSIELDQMNNLFEQWSSGSIDEKEINTILEEVWKALDQRSSEMN